MSAGWLITVARNKLVDHWRREAREERGRRLTAVDDAAPDATDRAVEEKFERARARTVLDELGAHHRAALTLRYVDGLAVPQVAEHLGRSVKSAKEVASAVSGAAWDFIEPARQLPEPFGTEVQAAFSELLWSFARGSAWQRRARKL